MQIEAHAVEDSFDSLGRQLGELMDEMTRRNFYQFSRTVTWQPAVNVYYDQTHFYLCVELSGLSKDEILVDVVGRKITIKGDRPVPPPPRTHGQASLLRMEISSGPFERLIELPDEADMTSVTARLTDGFLWITVARKLS